MNLEVDAWVWMYKQISTVYNENSIKEYWQDYHVILLIWTGLTCIIFYLKIFCTSKNLKVKYENKLQLF